jgi:6-phosphogluconolactonase
MTSPHLFDDPEAAAAGCAAFILNTLRAAITERGQATLAVSGGSTPKLMFRHMAATQFPWEKLDLYFADERCVPPEDEESNYALANDNLLKRVNYPLERVHRVLGELDPAEAARLYAVDIRQSFGLKHAELPVFDVIQLGMGPDGHTASLFPGSPLLDDRTKITDSVIDSPKPPKERVTLMPGVLLAARTVAYLIAGDDKREALWNVLYGPPAVKKWPSQLVARRDGPVEWFVTSSLFPKSDTPPPAH